MLHQTKTTTLFVTHDLHIALRSNCRVVMKQGAMQDLIVTEEEEKRIALKLKALDDVMLYFRNRIRVGDRLAEEELRLRLLEAQDQLK